MPLTCLFAALGVAFFTSHVLFAAPAQSAEFPGAEAVHHVKLTRVQIGASDFSLSSFGNPLDLQIKILEDGMEIGRPIAEGLEVLSPFVFSGRRGERLIDPPFEWRIEFSPNKNYQIVLQEMSFVAATKTWLFPPTPKLGQWIIGRNGGKLMFGNESYLQFEDNVVAPDKPVILQGYDFYINKSEFEQKLIVKKAGKTQCTIVDVLVEIIEPTSIKLGSDITGEGIPDVIISTFSGGAHCCATDYVLQLGPTLTIVDTINMGGSFVDLDGDGIAEVRTGDYTFDYWKMCHADSPIPTVVLKQKGGKYRPDTALMKQTGPTDSQIASLAAEIRKIDGWSNYASEADVCPGLIKLIKEIVGLLYSGHGDKAKSLSESAWPAGVTGFENFLADFNKQLRLSPYFGEMMSADRK